MIEIGIAEKCHFIGIIRKWVTMVKK
jgi:hypothetical protein